MNDLGKLESLLENNIFSRIDTESFRSSLRKFIIFLNMLQAKNLLPNESNPKNDSQDSNVCPICLDKKNDIHVSPCDHMFCFACVKK